MKKLLLLSLGVICLPLIGCSASIGTPPETSTTTYTTATPTAVVAPAAVTRTTVTAY